MCVNAKHMLFLTKTDEKDNPYFSKKITQFKRTVSKNGVMIENMETLETLPKDKG